jgi:hypothetical protein
VIVQTFPGLLGIEFYRAYDHFGEGPRFVAEWRDERSGRDGALGETWGHPPDAGGAAAVRFEGGGTFFRAAVPAWWVVVAMAALSAACAVWSRHGKRRISAGMCGRCGYDLRASLGRCPECGTAEGG